MNLPRTRGCLTVSALIVASLAGCSGGASTSQNDASRSLIDLIPVSLAAFPTKSSVEQFLETGTVSMSDGRSVKIVDTGEFSVPSDRGLAACGRSLGNVEGSGPLFSVDGRFRTVTSGDFNERERGEIANSIVLLSKEQIRDLADGTVDEVSVYESEEGALTIRRPNTELNPKLQYLIAHRFGTSIDPLDPRNDPNDPWSMLCAPEQLFRFDGGTALMILTGASTTESFVTATDELSVTEPEYVPALRMTLQIVHGKNGTMTTAKSGDGETHEMMVGKSES